MKGSQVNEPYIHVKSKKKKPKHLRHRGRKRAARLVEYAKVREQFLKDHPYCQHFIYENLVAAGLPISYFEEIAAKGRLD